jgi:transposase
VVDVKEWAEVRRMHFVQRLSIKEISRRLGRNRATIRRALRSDKPPRYERAGVVSKLEPYREEIHRLLAEDPRLPATRVRELIADLGYGGGRSILEAYLREVRPLFAPPPRVFQWTLYRPGEVCQFDLWEPSHLIPVGHGELRRGWVVVGCLGYSRSGAGALVFSKRAPDILWGVARCLWRLGGLPGMLVWDREGALHAGGGRPSDALAGFCGLLRVGWHLCEAGDPQAKGVVERLQGYMETSFEPGRGFANELDFQDQLDTWFDTRANVRTHRGLRCRPADRLPEDLAGMAGLPSEVPPDLDVRIVLRVAPDPFVRVDTCDYSLDPRLVGRRVEVRVGQREVTGLCLDTGEVACHHRRCYAPHRTITDPGHLALLKRRRGVILEPEVQVRPLARYDELIPA